MNNSEYVARMEDVLALYAEPYDSLRPVLCIDEQPITLHKDVYLPISASENHAQRGDYEYEQAQHATPGAFYEVFGAATARSLVERLEFHYTPKHGSWLNVAESELSVLTRQCITGHRMSDIELVQQQTQAWPRVSQ